MMRKNKTRDVHANDAQLQNRHYRIPMLIKNKIFAVFVASVGVVTTVTGIAVSLSGSSNSAHAAMPPNHLLFTTSLHCMACHSNVKAANGDDISIGWNWRSTIMANSSRDPYWQAGIRRETMDHPAIKSAIEDNCSTCHMPMQRFQARVEGGRGEVLRYLDPIHNGSAMIEPEAILEDAANPKATLAADGVSCTVCHQIRPDNFGQESSFDGGFIVDTQKKAEEREIFGPFDVDTGRTRVMHSSVGFTPTKVDHLQRAELCAGCHTLFTRAYDNQGNPAGVLPEQVPYQEWLHSDYSKTNTCQSCHMPLVQGEAPISSTLGKTHPEVRRHVFVGGNAFVLQILKDHRDELGVIAPPEELEASALRTEQQLGSTTASVEIKNARVAAGRLEFNITTTNKAGHKLPTAYPSRRVWLHVTVHDARGAVVFESGAPRADGSIAGNDNDEDAMKFEPHYLRITSMDQVQIYESIMGDYAEHPTTGLLFGTHYLKDNRLLPKGFDKASASEDVKVLGQAATDADFNGGSDTVTYSVPAVNGAISYSVGAELYYESIGFRWVQNLRGYDAPEPKRFVGYFEQHAQQSAKLLSHATIDIR
jgi:hypothetical protein